jgi:hypothetical protein
MQRKLWARGFGRRPRLAARRVGNYRTPNPLEIGRTGAPRDPIFNATRTSM